jgi:hypothetical protein
MSNGQSFRDTHEVDEYHVQVNGATDIIFTRFIILKLKRLTHGLEPEVTLSFAPNLQPRPGTVEKNNIFDAQFVIPLKEQDFSDIYSLLRSEKPVFFSYTAASNWTDPANTATSIEITQISLHSNFEVVGEVESVAATLKSTKLTNALSKLRTKIQPK